MLLLLGDETLAIVLRSVLVVEMVDWLVEEWYEEKREANRGKRSTYDTAILELIIAQHFGLKGWQHTPQIRESTVSRTSRTANTAKTCEATAEVRLGRRRRAKYLS